MGGHYLAIKMGIRAFSVHRTLPLVLDCDPPILPLVSRPRPCPTKGQVVSRGSVRPTPEQHNPASTPDRGCSAEIDKSDSRPP
jgi:hypothetical protein